MEKPNDDIRVGNITLPYNQTLKGWYCGGRVEKNPLLVQRIAERLHLREQNLKDNQHD
ncbi:DUF1317 family protein [Pantoea rwandensis]|uniref:DUF1317 family protein n=1 Tax=Pantoea rwandensis TaxID=1076550 RepID=UPI00111C8EF7|nr:DUF1317 family protein [Pantoea rwandensis]